MKSSKLPEQLISAASPTTQDVTDSTGFTGEAARKASIHLRLTEIGMVAIIIVVAFGLRFLAGVRAGLEVDEPIYHYAAAYAAQYGYPSVRAAVGQPTIPFLYHPPFFLWVLGAWFKLWGNTDYLTGRMLNILLSSGTLVVLYIFVRTRLSRGTALLVLVLVGSDAWIIFTNQAIYFENIQVLFIILAVWTYWRATEADASNTRQYITRYLLAGLFIGWVLIYKQIGGYLLVSALIYLVMQRRHWRGHALLLLATLSVCMLYVMAMHVAFGKLFDAATLTQIQRTLWARQSPGLSYNASTALQVVFNRYYIFPITIAVLLSGSALAATRFVQHLRGTRIERHPIILAWALGGVLFALSISLRSPHYMILWLVPLYTFLAKELFTLFQNTLSTVKWRRHLTHLLLAGLLFVNLWSFQARFLHLPGDALVQAEEYINTYIPSNALIVTQDFIGVDIKPQYVNIAYTDTPAKLFQSGASYVAFYWSTTEPLLASFGDTHTYCKSLKIFSGFKDHVEVCQLIPRVSSDKSK